MDLKAMLAGATASVTTATEGEMPLVRIGVDVTNSIVKVALRGKVVSEETDAELAGNLVELYEHSNGRGWRMGKRAESTVTYEGAKPRTLHVFENLEPEVVFETIGFGSDAVEILAERCQYGWFNGREVKSRENKFITFDWRGEAESSLEDVMSTPVVRYGSRQVTR